MTGRQSGVGEAKMDENGRYESQKRVEVKKAEASVSCWNGDDAITIEVEVRDMLLQNLSR